MYMCASVREARRVRDNNSAAVATVIIKIDF